MKPIFALLVAITGLFLVWLWASGRAQAVWVSLVNAQPDTAPSGGGWLSDPGAPGSSGAGGGGWLSGNILGFPIADIPGLFTSGSSVAAPTTPDPTSPFSFTNTGGFH